MENQLTHKTYDQRKLIREEFYIIYKLTTNTKIIVGSSFTGYFSIKIFSNLIQVISWNKLIQATDRGIDFFLTN